MTERFHLVEFSARKSPRLMFTINKPLTFVAECDIVDVQVESVSFVPADSPFSELADTIILSLCGFPPWSPTGSKHGRSAGQARLFAVDIPAMWYLLNSVPSQQVSRCPLGISKRTASTVP